MYLFSNCRMNSLVLVVDVLVFIGSIMLAIHLFTAFCAHHLPETKGREIGHTSLDDDAIADENKDGNEMSFRYDDGNEANAKPPSSRPIV